MGGVGAGPHYTYTHTQVLVIDLISMMSRSLIIWTFKMDRMMRNQGKLFFDFLSSYFSHADLYQDDFITK